MRWHSFYPSRVCHYIPQIKNKYLKKVKFYQKRLDFFMKSLCVYVHTSTHNEGDNMFIDVSKNNGKDYLRLAKCKRVMNGKGVKTARNTILLNIGSIDKFDDGQPEYLERLRKSFRAGTPLIPSLLPFCENELPREKYTFSFEEGNPNCIGSPKLFSNLFLERFIEELGLRNLFSSYKGFTKIKYDVYGFAKLLIMGRILSSRLYRWDCL
jgi:hypothetical protein